MKSAYSLSKSKDCLISMLCKADDASTFKLTCAAEGIDADAICKDAIITFADYFYPYKSCQALEIAKTLDVDKLYSYMPKQPQHMKVHEMLDRCLFNYLIDEHSYDFYFTEEINVT